VFLLNSRRGLFVETLRAFTRRAPLLPKLRGQFAEFLEVVSLAHLRLFASTTCVGLRYGHPIINV
jgi:hypothetical protein